MLCAVMRKHSSLCTPAFCHAVLAIALLTFGVRANDWPQFRGPDRDGLSKETGLLKDWPAGGPPLAWKATGLGKGYSTLSVADGYIYTIGDRPDASFVVVLK